MKKKAGRKSKPDKFSLDLEEGVFTWKDPKKIAASLKQSAEETRRRPLALPVGNEHVIFTSTAPVKIGPKQKEF